MERSKKAAAAIVADLCGRYGLKHEWAEIEEEQQKSIERVWAGYIALYFDEHIEGLDEGEEFDLVMRVRNDKTVPHWRNHLDAPRLLRVLDGLGL